MRYIIPTSKKVNNCSKKLALYLFVPWTGFMKSEYCRSLLNDKSNSVFGVLITFLIIVLEHRNVRIKN